MKLDDARTSTPVERRVRLRVLTLRVKRKWWDQIANGTKTVELRLQTDYWRKRLIGQQYDEIHIWLGYPSRTATDKLLKRRWRLVTPCEVLHEEFGPTPVAVFAIDVGVAI